MKILVLPRETANPYQALLYGEMRRRGARVSYLGALTPSHTLNLLLLPLELAGQRLTGARLVHLHWTYAFSLPGAERFPVLRRVTQAWFTVWLSALRVLGMHLVWTVHNVLPHGAVSPDDIRACRQLAGACDLALAHSQSALAELAALGAVPRRTAIVPHGPLAPSLPAESLRTPGTGNSPRRLLFFGKVREYKGVDDLLTAFAVIPADVGAHLTVAGECRDPSLRSALHGLARRSPGRIELRLERVPDEEVASLFSDADAVVLPFREITTSGSAVAALCHGRPLVVPDLAAFDDLPDEAVIRYDGTVQGLADALVRIALADAEALAAMSIAARAYCSTITWDEIAQTTIDEMAQLLTGRPVPVEAASRSETGTR